MTKLIVGLGNPGDKYKLTRHNLGFITIDDLAARLGLEFTENKKLNAQFAKAGEIILLKPLTFMNLSGQSIKAALNFYKLGLNQLIVLHDDLDIDLGKFKTTASSRAAGHNGIKSIIDELGTQDFFRYRIGIRPTEPTLLPIEKFVLEKFTASEFEIIQETLKIITQQIKKSLK